jgi:hypothetical protein
LRSVYKPAALETNLISILADNRKAVEYNPFRVEPLIAFSQGWLQKAQPTLGFEIMPLQGIPA